MFRTVPGLFKRSWFVVVLATCRKTMDIKRSLSVCFALYRDYSSVHVAKLANPTYMQTFLEIMPPPLFLHPPMRDVLLKRARGSETIPRTIRVVHHEWTTKSCIVQSRLVVSIRRGRPETIKLVCC